MPSDTLPSRAELWRRLRPCMLGEPKPNTLPGGRSEALRRLHAYDPSAYGRTRNYLDAPVSRLSPYLRHGMISAVEVREHLRTKFPHDSARCEEFLRQLAWRDFFEKVLAWYGRAIDDDLEEPKHGVARSSRLPLDVLHGQTGLPCIDGMLAELFETGYLHNHARLWFAAYLCHFRGVRWQQGAKLFRQFLYDGDIASNSSSWQWVESTFAAKPYFMNRTNIATFSKGRWCDTCRVRCPFDADYPTLQQRLFGGATAPLANPTSAIPPLPPSPDGSPAPTSPVPATAELLTSDCGTLDSAPSVQPASDLVWVHDAALSWEDPALKANPTATVVFVIDEPRLRAEPWAAHRWAFVLDGLDELFQHLPNEHRHLWIGDPVECLSELARRSGASTIHVSEHPNPWVVETCEILRRTFRVVVHPRPTLAEYTDEPRRFSRYWERVAPQILGYRPKPKSRWHS